MLVKKILMNYCLIAIKNLTHEDYMFTTTHNNTIQHTTDFSKFIYINENRPIRPRHVSKLIESIEKDNRLYLHPVIVHPIDDKLLILDGQHRVKAAQALNIPVYFIINHNPTPSSMIDDQISLNWALPDYFNFHIKKGNPEYLKCLAIMQEYDFTFHQIFYLLGSQKYAMAKILKNGDLKLNEMCIEFIKSTYLHFKKLREIYCPDAVKSILGRRDFIGALFWFYRTFPHQYSRLIGHLQDHFDLIDRKCDRASYERILVTIYNKHKEGSGILHPSDKERVTKKKIKEY